MLRHVSADNQIGAQVGDKVVIDMPDFIDIFLSAKEYVIPMFIAFFGMIGIDNLLHDQLLQFGSYLPFIVQVLTFVVLLQVAKAAFRKFNYSNAAKPKQAIKIVKIVQRGAAPMPLKMVSLTD